MEKFNNPEITMLDKHKQGGVSLEDKTAHSSGVGVRVSSKMREQKGQRALRLSNVN